MVRLHQARGHGYWRLTVLNWRTEAWSRRWDSNSARTGRSRGGGCSRSAWGRQLIHLNFRLPTLEGCVPAIVGSRHPRPNGSARQALERRLSSSNICACMYTLSNAESGASSGTCPSLSRLSTPHVVADSLPTDVRGWHRARHFPRSVLRRPPNKPCNAPHVQPLVAMTKLPHYEHLLHRFSSRSQSCPHKTLSVARSRTLLDARRGNPQDC